MHRETAPMAASASSNGAAVAKREVEEENPEQQHAGHGEHEPCDHRLSDAEPRHLSLQVSMIRECDMGCTLSLTRRITARTRKDACVAEIERITAHLPDRTLDARRQTRRPSAVCGRRS